MFTNKILLFFVATIKNFFLNFYFNRTKIVLQNLVIVFMLEISIIVMHFFRCLLRAQLFIIISYSEKHSQILKSWWQEIALRILRNSQGKKWIRRIYFVDNCPWHKWVKAFFEVIVQFHLK